MQTLPPKHIFLAQALSYAGTLPLVLAVFAAFFQMEEGAITMDVLEMARFYTAAIIAFLSGIHWAVFILCGGKCPANMLLSSVGTLVFAFVSLLMPEVRVALALQSLCFLYLLVRDYRLKEAKILPVWFYGLRHNATAIMVVCLMMLELS